MRRELVVTLIKLLMLLLVIGMLYMIIDHIGNPQFKM